MGVHRVNSPDHVNHPAANNHQSNTDNIVKLAPAFQLHSNWRLFNLLNLPFFLSRCCPYDVCVCCDVVLIPGVPETLFDRFRRVVAHLMVHLFGKDFRVEAFVILKGNEKYRN